MHTFVRYYETSFKATGVGVGAYIVYCVYCKIAKDLKVICVLLLTYIRICIICVPERMLPARVQWGL